MARKKMLKAVDKKASKIDFSDDACVQAKQFREPFIGAQRRTSWPLERIYSDVCKPIDLQAVDMGW